ncbi:FxsA family protein [Pseudoalteromonas sp. MMG010]|uniref:FxsA family protein n=1 Tax=Pseudoalteromonas sp. MMG010 TaxID=2822685 RepID=UPI001B3A14F0|nr:FxsA family protein [Pseudoalteromonas sp. MMG010]MBQ4832709.1 FxsA family protein [Pseudoalteromonas sp. MMG010]
MFRFLFVLFIIIPIIEIALLIQVSEVIGGFATIALVILTAILGAKMVKQQGMGAMQNVQSQMAQGQMPAKELFTGICVVIAGVLLLTPGIMTDVFGLLLLTPAIRNKLAAGLASQATVKMSASMQQNQRPSGFSQQSTQQNNHQVEHPTTIDGEFERKD